MITRQEWDKIWWEQFRELRRANANADLILLQKAANTYMDKRYGVRPPEDKVAGPPWWMQLGAAAIGVPMGILTKFWAFMNGKKLVVGAVITALASIAGILPVVLAAVGVEAILIGKIVGVATMIVGAAHKAYKFIYKEEHQ